MHAAFDYQQKEKNYKNVSTTFHFLKEYSNLRYNWHNL